MEQDEVKKKLDSALQRLFKCDIILLENDANERSITHRLAIYIEDEFPSWNVDCEYNRVGKGNTPKRITICYDHIHQNISPDDTDAQTVYPDIIVHKRGTRESNLLVVEVKKSSNTTSNKCDLLKLKEYKKRLDTLILHL